MSFFRHALISQSRALLALRTQPAPSLPSIIGQTRGYAAKKFEKNQKKTKNAPEPAGDASSSKRTKGGRRDEVEEEVEEEEYVGKGKSKSKKGTTTADTLVAGSKQPLTGEPLAEYGRAEEKMSAALVWFRKECSAIEARASGRVTPAVLAPVRVILPDAEPNEDGTKGVRLEEVATVGVREGTTIVITLFEENSIKYVEQAIYDAKLPNIVPQRQDTRTIKIPIPKPTVDARLALFTSAQRSSEDTKAQIRKHHQASVKKGKFVKFSIEIDEFQKLNDKYIADIDKIVVELRKVTGPK